MLCVEPPGAPDAALGPKYICHQKKDGSVVPIGDGGVVLEFRIPKNSDNDRWLTEAAREFEANHGQKPRNLVITTSSGAIKGRPGSAPAPPTGGNTKYYYEDRPYPPTTSGGSAAEAGPSGSSKDKMSSVDEMAQDNEKLRNEMKSLQDHIVALREAAIAEREAAVRREQELLRELRANVFTHPPGLVHPVTMAPMSGPSAVLNPAQPFPVSTPDTPVPTGDLWDDAPAAAPAAAPAVALAPAPKICKVCKKAEATMRSLHCRHRATCLPCSETFSQRSRRDTTGTYIYCPECGQKIHGFIPDGSPPDKSERPPRCDDGPEKPSSHRA